MEQLERPDEALWDERRLWFEEREAARGRAGAPSPGTQAPSEQACALMIDLQAGFCAGAWSAVIVLAAAIVDAQAPAGAERRADVPGVERKTLRWLRGLRNRLVHEDPGNPAITIEDHWLNRDTWERSARRAVEAALDALYPAPGGG